METTKAPWASPATGSAPAAAATVAPWARGQPTPPPAPLAHAVVEQTAAEQPLDNTIVPSYPSLRSEAVGFEPAKRRISSQADLKHFLASNTLKEFVAFILWLNRAVEGKKNSDLCPISSSVSKLLDVLDQLDRWVDEIPPVQQSLRYGNPAFKTWFSRVADHAAELILPLLSPATQGAVIELSPYLIDSFGNQTRIDYGTGHETNFCAFLYCLARLGVVAEEDSQALVTKVVAKYLKLMRKVQTTYWLEPAGSHGVWGLDDYQFLPFIWGSSQLINHKFIRPKSISSDEVLEGYHEDYLYLEAVRFVKKVKTGPLWETSPILNDISGVASWSKVNSGLLKMYHAELLAKFPIMQHFLFGSLLPYE